MDIGSRKLSVVSVAGMIAASAATLALGIASPVVLTRGLLGDSELLAWAAFLAAMVLVAATTVVGTLWSGPNLLWGSAVGLLLAAPPVSIVMWIGVIQEGDALGPLAAFFVTGVALAVSGATWAAAFGLAFWLKNRPSGRAAAPLVR